MLLHRTLVSLCALFSLFCYAAPVTKKSYSGPRKTGNLSLDLAVRAEPSKYTGGYKPVPNHHIFKTETNTYTGKELNKAARNSLAHAKLGTHSHVIRDPDHPQKLKAYPNTQSSGFPSSADPTGKQSGKVVLHGPITNKNSDFSKSPARIPNPAGPDRVVAWKQAGEKKFSAHISYHDTRKKIGDGATQHPATLAKEYHPSKTQARHKKIEFALSKPPRPANYKPRPKPPSKSAQKKANFAKHNAKQAQKFAGKAVSGQKKAQKKAKK